MTRTTGTVAYVVAVFGLTFWGYALDGVHFSDFLYFLDQFPALWGLAIIHPSGALNYEFLYHNEGVFALLYYGLHRLPLGTVDKLVFINSLNLSLQLLNAILLVWVCRALTGSARVFPIVLMYLVYPFAAGNHFWVATLPNNLAATFFLSSLGLFLQVDYAPGKLGRNVMRWMLPSLALLWLSIVTVEYALCLSPLYVYLALCNENTGSTGIRFKRLLTPYTAAASVFGLTSLLPVFLFTQHNVTVFSYASRFSEMAGSGTVAPFIVGTALIVGNVVFSFASYVFANTAGLLVYPVVDIARNPAFLSSLDWKIYVGVVLLAMLAVGGCFMTSGRALHAPGGARRPAAGLRLLLTVGVGWVILAYLPLTLAFRYPRNVGLGADRINLLGSMGVALCVGGVLCWLQERLVDRPTGRRLLAGGIALLTAVLLLNLQMQKAMFLEAEHKEDALHRALIDARGRLSQEGLEPIFLVDRAVKLLTPRNELRAALGASSRRAKAVELGQVIVGRYFTRPVATTSFHFLGLDWFLQHSGMEHYAKQHNERAATIYLLEDPLVVTEDEHAFTIGRTPTEDMLKGQDAFPSEDKTKQQSYSKQQYQLVVVELAESTFTFGGELAFNLKPYRGGR